MLGRTASFGQKRTSREWEAMKNKGYRITVGLAFAWTVLLPFLWAYRLSIEFGLTGRLAFLAYRMFLFAFLALRLWSVLNPNAAMSANDI